MAASNDASIQDALDHLRSIRGTLYAIPNEVVAAMSLSDQIKYGDSLSDVSSAIQQIENARLKELNDSLDESAESLKSKAEALARKLSNLQSAMQIIRVASDALALIAKIAIAIA